MFYSFDGRMRLPRVRAHNLLLIGISIYFAIANSVCAFVVTSYTYDTLGRVKSVINSDGSTVNYSYDAAGNRTQVVRSVPVPVAVADTIAVNFNTARSFDPRSNDSDPNGNTLTITAVGSAAHGTVAFSGSSITYTPISGYYGGDSFTYTITNSKGGKSTAIVNVTVDTPPVAVNDSTTTAYLTAKTIDPRTNDSDANADILTVIAVGTAAHGTTSFTGTSVTYTPATGFSGTDNFTYTISDGKGGTATATVSVTVGNGTPFAGNDTKTASYNTTLTFDPRANDSDPNGDALSITAVSQPAHGTISYSTSSVTYTPGNGYIGSDSFTYTISDGKGGTAVGTVSVTVIAPPGPTSQDKLTSGQGLLPGTSLKSANNLYTLTMQTDGNLVIYGPSGAIWSTTTSGKAVALAIMQADGNLVLYSSSGQSFWNSTTSGHSGAYLIMQGDGNLVVYSSTGARLWASNTANTPPVAVNDTTSTAYLTTKTIDPRANDTDANGDALTVTGVGSATHGTTSFTGASVTYTPATGFSGSDSFTYTISDGKGGSATATVTVTVANAPPVAVNDTTSTAYLTAKTIDPRANDTDANGDALTVTTVGSAAHGTTARTTTSVTYTPASGFSGSDSFTYTISDGKGGTASASVAITVANGAPTAVNDSTSTAYQTAKTIDPRINDSDPNGDALTVTGVGAAAHGTTSFTSTSVTYTPASGFSGSDSFTYTISDGKGGTASATVTVTVANSSVTLNVTAATNLRTLANSSGYTGATNATYQFVVPSGTTVTGASNGGIAIDTGTWPSGVTLSLLVQGNVYGGGGNGGTGGDGYNDPTGHAGGDAIYVRAPITVTVNSGASIKSGGGGGAGGAANGTYNPVDVQWYYEAGGAGAGGFPNGVGGAASNGNSGTSHAGANGTTSGGGGGGASYSGGGNVGGAGGTAGAAGAKDSGNQGTAGAAGYAIRKNGNAVTVTNSGTITGTQG